jgi:fructose-1,6-bisphosphatase/inositol monophosphatase family enzyme
MERFGGPVRGLDRKSSRTDMVSDADRDAERLISDLIVRERPGDAVFGEEGADLQGRSGRRWVVDPLDGTTNFLYGFPSWSVSIALEDDDGIAAAVVHDPWRDETFRAARGEGADLNGEPIQVTDCDRLELALVATGFGYAAERRSEQAAVLSRVLPRVRDIRRAGSAALDLSYLAAGRVDAYYERDLKPWDWDAGRLLVAEAGGALADLPGEPPALAAAASPELLSDLVGLVSG